MKAARPFSAYGTSFALRSGRTTNPRFSLAQSPSQVMGQQQLLLLVLGIVIVGLAVVAGIQAFGENQKKANADALVNDGVRLASDAQAWALKPKAFGGGDGDFGGIAISQLGYESTSGVYENINGKFAFTTITSGSPGSVEITGCSLQSYDGTYNQVVISVTGTGANQVSTSVQNSATDCTPTSDES